MAQARTLSPETLGILSQRPLPLLAVAAVKIAVCLTTWATRRRTRAALAQLEPWQLADLGLTRGQADKEAARAFWRT